MKAGGSSQKQMLFIRGKAMSGAPIMIGTNQLPKPPIIAGMTMKKTMIRPCARDQHVPHVERFVEIGGACRRECSVRPGARYWMPGSASSIRIRPEMVPPMMPAMIAKIR